MEYFDEFSGFGNMEKERLEEEKRLDALNAKLCFRLENSTYEETLQGLFCALTFGGGVAEVTERKREFA